MLGGWQWKFKDVGRCKKYSGGRNDRAWWLIVSGETNVSEVCDFNNLTGQLPFVVLGNAEEEQMWKSSKFLCNVQVKAGREWTKSMEWSGQPTQTNPPGISPSHQSATQWQQNTEHGSSTEQGMRPPSNGQLPSSSHDRHREEGVHQSESPALKRTLFLYSTITSRA